MSLGLRLSLMPRIEVRQEQRLEQRLALEQKLEARLSQQISLKISLSKYLAQEDFIKRLINWASENNTWRNFKKQGFDFNYAAVPYNLAKPIADAFGCGFAHCMYNLFEAILFDRKAAMARGDWVLFVVEDLLPKKNLIDNIAIHERGEELSLGNHYFASKLEFAFAQKNKGVREHVKFIDTKYPSKFVDLTQKVLFPVLPDELVDLLNQSGKRNQAELTLAEEMISKYPLPVSVLKKMDKYSDITQAICEKIRNCIGPTQGAIYRLTGGVSYGPPEDIAQVIHDKLYELLKSIAPAEARVASRASINEKLREYAELVRHNLYDILNAHIILPATFDEAYNKAMNGEMLTAVEKKASKQFQ